MSLEVFVHQKFFYLVAHQLYFGECLHEALELVDIALGMINQEAVYYVFHVFVVPIQGFSEKLVELVKIFVGFEVVSPDRVECVCDIGEKQCHCVQDQV